MVRQTNNRASQAVSFYPFTKRIIDLVVASSMLMILSPVLLIVALLNICFLGKPIFFKQNRPGLNGEIFSILKFRTLLEATDHKGQPLPDDQRVSRYGLWLRSTSLDELPALLNVITGDMSLVGPRPLLPEYLPLYSEEQNRRHIVRPGITGLAQVNGRNSLSWPEKFTLDVEYVDNMSFIVDVKILLKTVVKVVRKDGIAQSSQIGMERFTGNHSKDTNSHV